MIAAAFKTAQDALATTAPQEVMVGHTAHKDIDAAQTVAQNAKLELMELAGARDALAANDPVYARADMGRAAANDPIAAMPSWGSSFLRFAIGVAIPFTPDFESGRLALMSFMGGGSEVTHDQPTQYLAEPSAKSSFEQVAAPETPAANEPSMDTAFTMPSFASALDGGPSAADVRSVADEAAGAMLRKEAELGGALSVLAVDEDAMAEYASFADGLSGHVTGLRPDPDFVAKFQPEQAPAFRPMALTLG